MRLLECNSASELSLTKDFVGNDEIPPYAILSHTWKEGQEVTFSDLMDGTGKSKAGYDKIRFCGQQAKHDGLQYFWVDTCCIDKSNHFEYRQIGKESGQHKAKQFQNQRTSHVALLSGSNYRPVCI
jgi:hypothetical protein